MIQVQKKVCSIWSFTNLIEYKIFVFNEFYNDKINYMFNDDKSRFTIHQTFRQKSFDKYFHANLAMSMYFFGYS